MPYEAGATLRQRDLAKTLRNISRRGVDGFYKGATGTALVVASKAGRGIITQADLDAYQTRELAPVECDYRGFHIVAAPPPSSGGVVLCEMLNILEGYPLRDYGFGSARAVHFQIEAMRHAYVDRNFLLGDPAFVRNPLEQLLDKKYAEGIRSQIDPHRAGNSAALKPGLPANEGVHTTHYSIADRFGNAVAVTYTLNDWFGARVTAAGTGVLLNDEMDDFTAKAGVPNMYGLVQGETNKIEPGKRPLSSMTPTIVTRDGKPWMILGTPGGSRIITAVLLTILNVVDYDMDIQEAVDAPRIHQQWLPEETFVETRALSPDTRGLLLAMGHKLIAPQPENHVAAILIGAPARDAKPVGNLKFYGALDPRRSTGLALGY
jgi:gamma-glutamyltranspeptidase/glutathione hydrolase